MCGTLMSFSVDWNAVSAVGTLAAVIVSVFLATEAAMREGHAKKQERDGTLEALSGINKQALDLLDDISANIQRLTIHRPEQRQWMRECRIIEKFADHLSKSPHLDAGASLSCYACVQLMVTLQEAINLSPDRTDLRAIRAILVKTIEELDPLRKRVEAYA